MCISFGLHCGVVVIPKSVKLSRIEENLKATQVGLDSKDMHQLRGLDRNLRVFTFPRLMVDGMTPDIFWDVKTDEVFTVKQPEKRDWKLRTDHNTSAAKERFLTDVSQSRV